MNSMEWGPGVCGKPRFWKCVYVLEAVTPPATPIRSGRVVPLNEHWEERKCVCVCECECMHAVTYVCVCVCVCERV